MAPPFPRKRWTSQEWDQLKAITKKEMIRLMDKDPNWKRCDTDGSRYIYENKKYAAPYDRVAIHYHPKDSYRNPSLLRDMLDHICWTGDYLRSIKAIK